MSEPQTPPAPTTEPAAPPEMRRIFTATCIIGPPGSGKTSLFDGFATYLWETYKRVLLLYSWDGGAIPTLIQKRMKQGLIRFWRARTRSAGGLGLETVYLASKGYWPRHINPETGETSPAVELVAPITSRYLLRCPAGHDLKAVTAIGLIVPLYCETCKQMIAREQLQVTESAVRTKGFELVGGVGYDGLTSMSNIAMEHMDQQRGAGQIGGEKSAFGGSVHSGAVTFGGNNRADYGFSQSRAQQFVNNSLSIPYLVEGPVFTALSNETTDDGGLSIVGMKLPGQAATGEGSAWFGNVYEMGQLLDDSGKAHFALYLRPFTDAQGRRHLLKTSATPTGLPAVLIDPPIDEKRIGVVANLGSVFRMLDEDLRQALADQDLAGVPGLGATPGEYGEAAESGGPSVAPSLPASGIAPLAMPAPTPAAPAVSMPAPTPAVDTAPRVKPRARATAAPQPVPVPTPVAPVVAAPTPTAAPVPAPPSPPSGTLPPPPPGMRPPAKAPGA